MSTRSAWLAVGVLLVAGIAGAVFFFARGQFGANAPHPKQFSYEELTGSLFLPAPKEPFRAPQVRELLLPTTADATSVWGATGRDFRGHIWVGVSAGSPRMSAYLLEYDPDADTWRDHGGVVDMRTHSSTAFPLDTKGLQRVLLYGSVTRDNAGRAYVGGWTAKDPRGQRPLVLQIDPAR